MKISYNWLKEYLKTLPPSERLAEKLTMAGLEVEGIEALGKGIKGVVVAQILSIEKHPNADRLAYCKVKTDKGIHSIVCGAKNMKAGDKVALALPGAILPNGIKIEKTKIRGVESEGMMCSEVELGLTPLGTDLKSVPIKGGQGGVGIMILPQHLPIGKDFTRAMGLDDYILNINVTPNRPDCLSILGIAREVGAITKVRLKEDKIKLIENGRSIKTLAAVSIDEPSLCRRYTARVIENIKVGPSPDWLKQRLESLGFRPINNIVDVTNYVMLEYGHPLHAFDYDLVVGKQIIVRRANENEKMHTLDGVERALTKDMLVIADAEKSIALAGIMGGRGSEITDATQHILLESAYFEPSSVRRTAKALGLSTESSYRFERGADIEGVARALDRAAQMIHDISGGEVAKGIIDKYPRPYKPTPIKVRLLRINKILGIGLTRKEAEDCLTRLGISFKATKVANKQDIVWNVIPPSFRVDIQKEIDIIEEIARIHGYEKIPTALPTAHLSATRIAGIDLIKEKIRDILTNSGFLEAINYSFISPKFFEITASDMRSGLKLLNPLTEEQSVMRQSLIPSLLQTLQYNVNHNNNDIKIFEVGRVFVSSGKENEERELISGLMSGLRYGEVWNASRESIDFYDVKGEVEKVLTGVGIEGYRFNANTDITFLHPGKASLIEADGKRVGIAGEIHPDILQRLDIKQSACVFEMDISAIMSMGSQKRYSPIVRYPMIVRDAAMIVNKEIQLQELYDAIKGLCIKLLEEVTVFDVYYGANIPEDKVSIAFHFMYRSPEKTLTDEEVNKAHSIILENLKGKFGIEIRGEGGTS